jgi:hypothetical protein
MVWLQRLFLSHLQLRIISLRSKTATPNNSLQLQQKNLQPKVDKQNLTSLRHISKKMVKKVGGAALNPWKKASHVLVSVKNMSSMLLKNSMSSQLIPVPMQSKIKLDHH